MSNDDSPDEPTAPPSELPPARSESPVPERDPGATWRGVRAALFIFVPAAVLHVLLMLAGLSVESDDYWLLFLAEGAALTLAIMVASAVVWRRLPEPSHNGFRAAAVIGVFTWIIFWGATCSVSTMANFHN